MKVLRIVLTSVLFLLLASLVSYADQVGVFNFDNDQVGQLTPFADSSNGISAAFTSPSDPGTFAVAQSIFQSLTGNVLLGTVSNPVMQVFFSQPLFAMSLDFAIIGQPTDFVGALLLSNGALVDTITATGTIPQGFIFPEGQLSEAGIQFDSMVLVSSAQNFAIDNLYVDGTSVPEPSSLVMLFSGTLGVGALGWRKLLG